MIGRYQQVFKKDVNPTTKTYKIQGAYIPVSRKAFSFIGTQVNLLNYLGYFLMGLSVLSIILILIGYYLCSTNYSAPLWQIVMIGSAFPGIIPVLIADDLIVYYCKKLVNINRIYSNFGIPFYDLKEYKDLISEKKLTKYLEKKLLITLNF